MLGLSDVLLFSRACPAFFRNLSCIIKHSFGKASISRFLKNGNNKKFKNFMESQIMCERWSCVFSESKFEELYSPFLLLHQHLANIRSHNDYVRRVLSLMNAWLGKNKIIAIKAMPQCKIIFIVKKLKCVVSKTRIY